VLTHEDLNVSRFFQSNAVKRSGDLPEMCSSLSYSRVSDRLLLYILKPQSNLEQRALDVKLTDNRRIAFSYET
jgi:hypothetical protein